VAYELGGGCLNEAPHSVVGMESRFGWFRLPSPGVSALSLAGGSVTTSDAAGIRACPASEGLPERGVGPSSAALRENSRAQQLEEQIERCRKQNFRRMHRATWVAPDTKKESANVEDYDNKAELWRKKTAEVDDMLDGIFRGARLEELPSKAVPAAEEYREDLRKEERLLRQLRGDVLQPSGRDPRTKVAERLENRRSGIGISLEGGRLAPLPDIPMVTLDVQGSKGRERVALVDIGTLRSRCRQLSQRVSVQEMLEQRKSLEREEQARLTGVPRLRFSHSLPALSRPSSTDT